jgi:hypothetical protein
MIRQRRNTSVIPGIGPIGYKLAPGTRMVNNTYVGPVAGPPVSSVGGITVPMSPIRLLYGSISGNKKLWIIGGVAIAIAVGYLLIKKNHKFRFGTESMAENDTVREFELTFGPAWNRLKKSDREEMLEMSGLDESLAKHDWSRLEQLLSDKEFKALKKEMGSFWKFGADTVKSLITSDIYLYKDSRSDKYYTLTAWNTALFDPSVYNNLGDRSVFTTRWGRMGRWLVDNDLAHMDDIIVSLNKWLLDNPGYHTKFKFDTDAPGQIMGYMSYDPINDKIAEKKDKGYVYRQTNSMVYPDSTWVIPEEIERNIRINLGLAEPDENQQEYVEEMILGTDKTIDHDIDTGQATE